MIVSCPSCRARFSFKRSAFLKTTKRRGKCLKCDTIFIIGPLPPLIYNSKPKGLQSQKTASKRPEPRGHTTNTQANKRTKLWTLAPLLTLATLLVGFCFHTISTLHYSKEPSPSIAINELRNTTVLEVQNLELAWETSGHAIQLKIQGELSNPTDMLVRTPAVTITLLDKNETPVLAWNYEIPRQVIPPKRRIQFQTFTDNPPSSAISVIVRPALPTLPR